MMLRTYSSGCISCFFDYLFRVFVFHFFFFLSWESFSIPFLSRAHDSYIMCWTTACNMHIYLVLLYMLMDHVCLSLARSLTRHHFTNTNNILFDPYSVLRLQHNAPCTVHSAQTAWIYLNYVRSIPFHAILLHMHIQFRECFMFYFGDVLIFFIIIHIMLTERAGWEWNTFSVGAQRGKKKIKNRNSKNVESLTTQQINIFIVCFYLE